MPQLDQFTYFSQFLWLCVFFMGFYVLLYNDGLPKVSRILKLRTRLVSQQSVETHHSDQHAQDTVIKESLAICVNYLNSSVSAASEWCNSMVVHFNSNQLQPVNQCYVRSLAEISVAQVMKRSALETISAFKHNTLFLEPSRERLSKNDSVLKWNSIYALRMQRVKFAHAKSGSRKKRLQNA